MKKLRNLLIVLLIVCLPWIVNAQGSALTAQWTQTLPEPNDLEGWALWYSADQTDWIQLGIIPFESEQVEYSYQFNFLETEGMWYFRLRAYDEVPNFSVWSEIASIDLGADVEAPQKPGSLIITKEQEDGQMADYWWGCTGIPEIQEQTTSANSTYLPERIALPTAGKITKVQVWCATGSDHLEVAVFTKDGNDFTDEHWVDLGVMPAMSFTEYLDGVDFDKDDLPVEAGEWVGFHIGSGTLARAVSGGPGYWYDVGDQIGDGLPSTFIDEDNDNHVQFRVWVETAVAGAAPTAILDGPLVGALGGPI